MKNDHVNRKDPLVSIIVPVYDVAAYLEYCVDSIRNQTYSTLEILLIDDGSTDGSGLICEKYRAKDERVRVIHKKNGGLSDARNTGIENSRGEYIAFVDSDDWVSEFYIEHLYYALLCGNAEIAVGGVAEVMPGDSVRKACKEISTIECLTSEECLKRILYQRNTDIYVVGKLYKRETIGKKRFPVGKLYEDWMFTPFVVAEGSTCVAMIQNQDYFYLQRNGSISYQKFSTDKLDALTHAEKVREYVSTLFPELKSAADSRYFSMACTMIMQIPQKGYENIKESIWREIKKYRREIVLDHEASLKNRGGALLSYFGLYFFSMIYKKVRKRGFYLNE